MPCNKWSQMVPVPKTRGRLGKKVKFYRGGGTQAKIKHGGSIRINKHLPGVDPGF